MNIPLNNIFTVSDLQKDYRKVINKAKRTKKPVIIMRGNDPEVAMLDAKVLEDLNQRLEDLEVEETLRIVVEGRAEYKASKTIKAKSLADLI